MARPQKARGRQVLEDVRILKARGLSMDAIARHLHVSRATLYRIINEDQ